jgi:transglutaminase-like putative cysteine protease
VDTTHNSERVEGAKLSVRHRTLFKYGRPVRNSVNTVRLEPRYCPSQNNLGSFVKVLPATRLRRFEDFYGNITHHFEIPAPHDRLEIESTIKVITRPLILSELAIQGEVELLKETDLYESTWQFLQESHRVTSCPQIWKQALNLTIGKKAVYSQAYSIMEWIHEKFIYAAGSTNVDTHINVVFETRQGVCQDFSHIMLGLCRSVGLPARYVSGYIYNGPKDVLIGSQASHAWCEVFLPGDGWVGFDPTNNTLADARYVKIAVGRDYDDVAPIRGTYMGGGESSMDVFVIVERI